VRRRYLVEGMVQGVGFRFFAQREGRRAGVTGWVRNLPDGRVEAVGDGAPDQLSSFEQALRRGPGSASVTNLHITEIPDEVELSSDFVIE
jgi:acylphosphatase